VTYGDVCIPGATRQRGGLGARPRVSRPCSPPTYVSIRQHTSAYVSIRQHTSAYVSIRQHTSAYVSIRHQEVDSVVEALSEDEEGQCAQRLVPSTYVSIRQHTYRGRPVRLAAGAQYKRPHTSTYVSRKASAPSDWCPVHTSAYVSIRQHTSAYVRIRIEQGECA
jgi:hypothetical protein